MRIRHKQPTLVSMWMLDVFCCALGCVTLLFLLNSRMAGDEAEKNRAALVDLAESRKKLTTALTDLEATKLRLNSEVMNLTTQLGAVKTEKDELARRLGITRDEAKSAQALLDATKVALNAAESKLDATAKELATVAVKAADADDLLRKKQKETDILAKKLTDAVTASDELARLLRKKDDERAVMVKQTADLQKLLDDMDARLLASRKELDATSAAAKLAATRAAEEMTAMKKAGGDELALARGQVKDLLKKIDDANATIIDLQGDKARLADKYDRFQKEIEARFAGIVTSGQRVVFVVDISGSMAKKDTEHADPTKWPIVVETVGKVMRSIVGLEKYQVVVFSSSARWLFGNGEWRTYTARSVDEVTTALLKVKPYDDTNLYAALEHAFKLRASGLDAVYVFSDGLPTSGPGLTYAQQNGSLKEIERSEILGKYVRKTLEDDWNRAQAGKRVKVHAIGFFFESPDVGAFLWALARENEGSFVGMSKP
jgi:predicted  nucleic acid-binding Zn-ribbon protein